MLDTARLNVFREVARRGSLSAAAEALAYTQPAISRQIATLEREAGAQLLERSARGIRLTEAGRVLLEHAEAILDRMTAAQAQVDAVGVLDGGRLRIGAFPTANASIVPRAIAAFATEHPNVELTLFEAVSADNMPRLIAGELDVVIGTEYEDMPGGQRDAVEVEPLIDDEMLVALPTGHPLAHKPRLHLRDFADETWIEGDHPDCRRPLLQACAAQGFEPRIRFGTEQWLGKQGLVAAGVGVTLIPGLAIATVRDDVVLRRLGRDAPRRTVVVVMPRGYRCPAVEPFVTLLRREAEDHCVGCYERARLDAPAPAAA